MQLVEVIGERVPVSLSNMQVSDSLHIWLNGQVAKTLPRKSCYKVTQCPLATISVQTIVNLHTPVAYSLCVDLVSPFLNRAT